MANAIEPILTVGNFGTHILPTTNGKFAFFGTVPNSCAGSFNSEAEAMNAFVTFFKSQPTEWQRGNVGNLRNDVFTLIFQS